MPAGVMGHGVNRYGRRGALTPDIEAKIVEAVEQGSYLKIAAQAAGIGQNTLSLWLGRGRAAAATRDAGEPVPEVDERYLRFLEAVTQAQATAETTAVAAWRKAFPDDWRAARDFLARSNPERWAGVTRVQMTTEEAERRIDDAVNEALLSVGIDATGREGDPDDALDEGGVVDA
jgi:hypothetical protein